MSSRLHARKHKKKIRIKLIEETRPKLPKPLDMVIATTATNVAGGTISFKRALTLMHDLPKDQLESSGLSGLYVTLEGIYEKLEEIQKENRRVLGQGERIKGEMLPKIVKEYYEIEGYRVKEADENIDKEFKIDMIAERSNEIRAIQVKKGTVSSQEIREICEKAPAYFIQKISNQRVKIIEIIARYFPHDYLERRDEFFKKQNEVSLNYRDYHQIVQKLPKYRYLLS